MPLYVDDFEAATAHLSVAEDGIYNRMMRLCWRTPGCSVPAESAWLIRRLRITADEFETVAKPVIDEFFKVKNGRYFQARLTREFDAIENKSLARKKAGKLGGSAKASKNKDIDPSNATILPRDTRAFPEPEPKPDIKKEGKPSSLLVSIEPDHFEAWWLAFPRKAAKPVARKAYQKAVSKIGGYAPEVVLRVGAERYAAQCVGKEQEFIAHGATWLNQERWNDEPDSRNPENRPSDHQRSRAQSNVAGAALALARRQAARAGGEGWPDNQGGQPSLKLISGGGPAIDEGRD